MRSACSARVEPVTTAPQRGHDDEPVATVAPQRAHAALMPPAVVTAACEASRGLLWLPVTELRAPKVAKYPCPFALRAGGEARVSEGVLILTGSSDETSRARSASERRQGRVESRQKRLKN